MGESFDEVLESLVPNKADREQIIEVFKNSGDRESKLKALESVVSDAKHRENLVEKWHQEQSKDSSKVNQGAPVDINAKVMAKIVPDKEERAELVEALQSKDRARSAKAREIILEKVVPDEETREEIKDLIKSKDRAQSAHGKALLMENAPDKATGEQVAKILEQK